MKSPYGTSVKAGAAFSAVSAENVTKHLIFKDCSMTLDHEDIQAIADALAARLAPVLGVAALPTIPPPRTDDYQRRRADALNRLLGPKKSRRAAA